MKSCDAGWLVRDRNNRYAGGVSSGCVMMSKMKIGMHHWMRPEPLESTLRRLQRYGYDCIELMGEPDQFRPELTLPLLEKYAVECTGAVAMMTPGRDLTQPDRDRRQATVEYLIETLRMIKQLGGQVLSVFPAEVGHTVAHENCSPEDCWNWCVESLKRVAETADSLGLKIGIEPICRWETNFFNRHDQALELARAVGPTVGVVLDTYHMALEEDSSVQAIRAIGDKLLGFHVADSNRRPPGEGQIDWKTIFSELGRIGYQGVILAEFAMPLDRTPTARPPTVWRTAIPDIPGADPAQLQFIADHGSGVLSEEDYDAAVKQTMDFLSGHLRVLNPPDTS